MSAEGTAPEAATDAGFAPRLEPPYYAVIFTSRRRAGGDVDYATAAARMEALAAAQPGYLGVETTRGADGLGITVSYWRTLDDIAAWRQHAEHASTRERGRADWYAGYELRIAKVERAYGWRQSSGNDMP